MRWLLISKIPLNHTNLPLFSRYFTCIDMVIFFVDLAVSTVCVRFCSIIVAQLWFAMVVRRPVLATEVAFVVIVRVMVALFVVVIFAIATARLAIFGIVATLLVGVLGLVAMDAARFTRKLRRSFSLGLIAFVVPVARRFVTTIRVRLSFGIAMSPAGSSSATRSSSLKQWRCSITDVQRSFRTWKSPPG
jgi:hypothetical protein